jgi:hypothetical protein
MVVALPLPIVLALKLAMMVAEMLAPMAAMLAHHMVTAHFAPIRPHCAAILPRFGAVVRTLLMHRLLMHHRRVGVHGSRPHLGHRQPRRHGDRDCGQQKLSHLSVSCSWIASCDHGRALGRPR